MVNGYSVIIILQNVIGGTYNRICICNLYFNIQIDHLRICEI